MRMSQLFSQTLRETPAEAEVASHQLLLRAGYMRQLAAGVFTLLPLGLRVMNRIAAILRQEMEAIGAQELLMPVVNPADLWRESGRWQAIDAELGRFVDRAGRDMVLAMTHEEVISDLVRREVRSYRQLPRLLYHIQTKWRDDPRPRAGLIRAREFMMKDSYSLDADWDGLDAQYRAHYQAYFNIFRRCGLDVQAVAADVGMMGGELAHEFMYLTSIGEDSLLFCDSCRYSANRQVATFRKPQPEQAKALPLQKVATPECKSIQALASFLDIPAAQTAKAVFLMASLQKEDSKAGEVFVFAIVRGDMEVNDTKLANAVKARSLRPATEDEIRAVSAEPGYASPVGLPRGGAVAKMLCVVDELIPQSTNLVAGANQAGFHLRNVNYGRDYTADIVQDITAAQEGDACPNCGNAMRLVRGVEIGNIFKLGTRFSDAMGCKYLDKDGVEKPVIMGCYGIGLGRLLSCIAEEHHDDKGLIWPVTVAPYPLHLVALGAKREASPEATLGVSATAESLYASLQAAGLEALYDDRAEAPGVKFNDADLIGLPLRLTVSERSLGQGGVEAGRRHQAERVILPLEGVIDWVQRELQEMEAAVLVNVKPEVFR
jgi:prolyl-tRNA synthetase